ncbi:hypothetical protein SAMN04487950_1180 [Halogranum rubrum]|uniref:Uncharacterized protein n=2 Tax=Halogranum rubrum TaxID=553466 RepID=A0A1I4CGY4_9EURY|nr:hypothetical protein SAMN04487950_1180 [Halogranum rubrum]
MRLLYAEVALLVLGVGLGITDAGSKATATSLTDVFATLSFVTAMILVVAAAVGAVGVGLLEGYRTLDGRGE